jgi:hypothetical protein
MYLPLEVRRLHHEIAWSSRVLGEFHNWIFKNRDIFRRLSPSTKPADWSLKRIVVHEGFSGGMHLKITSKESPLIKGAIKVDICGTQNCLGYCLPVTCHDSPLVVRVDYRIHDSSYLHGNSMPYECRYIYGTSSSHT